MWTELQLEHGENRHVLLGMPIRQGGAPSGSQDLGFICLLTGVSLGITVERRWHYQVDWTDASHTNNPPWGWAPRPFPSHVRLPGPDGPILCKELIVGRKGMKWDIQLVEDEDSMPTNKHFWNQTPVLDRKSRKAKNFLAPRPSDFQPRTPLPMHRSLGPSS